ncbi:MAG: DNA topoisomerase 3 [Flavobacteriales bacterium]
MIVCIAEKPSVAREIAKILKADKKKDGYLEGNGYQVTWTFGHFCTLYAPHEYETYWKSWTLNSLPMLPKTFQTRVMEDAGIQKQFQTIKTLVNAATEVINCGDAGQEGELIQRWVLNSTDYQGVVKRLWISSLTKDAIVSGFKNLRPAEEFDKLYYAGSSRAIGDWLLGMNATRLFTLMYAKKNQVLSVGRVQTPTLALMVNRQLEINAFTSADFWEIETLFKTQVFQLEHAKIESKEKAEEVFKQIENQEFKITSSEKKKSKESPPRLFDLTSLQVYCNSKFAFTADQTLKLIQSLYEKKVVTYPRVDTTFLPEDVYPQVPEILSKLSDYQNFTKELSGKPIRKSKKVFDNTKITDHHAIIPTGYHTHLQPLEAQVYDAVCRRFIAVFYPDCLLSNTIVKGEVKSFSFRASGKEILDAGWRVLYPPKKSDSKKESDKEQFIPNFQVGEQGSHQPKVLKKQTRPPKAFTEATLLRAMETAGKHVEDEELRDLMKQNGIGRPSTRANIIETLFRRNYIKRKRKQLIPTDLGMELISLIDNELLKSAELTGRWEKQLKDIEKGEFKAQQFIHNMKKMVDDLVFEVRTAKPKPRKSVENSSKPVKKSSKSKLSCPACGTGEVLKGKTRYGCSNWKSGCVFALPFEFCSKKISENQWSKLLTKGKSSLLKNFVQNGEKVNGVLVLDEQHKVSLRIENQDDKQDSDTLVCPKCKSGTILKGQQAFGCSAWQKGCDFKVDFEVLKAALKGRKATKSLIRSLLLEHKF